MSINQRKIVVLLGFVIFYVIIVGGTLALAHSAHKSWALLPASVGIATGVIIYAQARRS